jgi:Flp pilus assembly protein TadG
MFRFSARREREGGQIIVLFALAMIAIIAMVGLVLDGGSAFSQRRGEQSAADLAALAGANSILINGDENQATVLARATAAENGFTHGVGATVVTVSFNYVDGSQVRVDISALHRNNFVAIVGMPTWTVGVTATAKTGSGPNGALGAGPMIFNREVFGPGGFPKPEYTDPLNPYPFGETNNDAPETPGDFAWTNYGTGNVNSDEVRDIIEGKLIINREINVAPEPPYIGQENQGNHTTLYTAVDHNMSGKCYPVPVVDDNGIFQGWATFCIQYADKHNKNVYGYFKSPHISENMTVGCPTGKCPQFFGTYMAPKLIN